MSNFGEILSMIINWIYKLLTKNKVVVILITILGLGVVPWQSIFPAKPFVSTSEITIPAFADNHQDEFSIINPSNKHYQNLIIKLESMNNSKISPSSVIIEPKEHNIFSKVEGVGSLDTNFAAIYEDDKIVYIKVNDLKANDKIGYILRYSNKEAKQQNIKIEIIKHSEIEQFDFTPFFIYYIDGINKLKCSMEQWPEGIYNRSRRVNSCFGGLKYNVSKSRRDVISLNIWLYPEWNEDEKNFIFDTGPEDSTNRLSIYRYDYSLITEVFESNSFSHRLKKKVDFSIGWNSIYLALDPINKTYVLYLNGRPVFEYTFKELEFGIPPLYYYGVNSNENSKVRNFGNFRIDEVAMLSKVMSTKEINELYNNGKGYSCQQIYSGK